MANDDEQLALVKRAMHAAMMRHDPHYTRPASWDEDAKRLLADLRVVAPSEGSKQ